MILIVCSIAHPHKVTISLVLFVFSIPSLVCISRSQNLPRYASPLFSSLNCDPSAHLSVGVLRAVITTSVRFMCLKWMAFFDVQLWNPVKACSNLPAVQMGSSWA
jgi:hypothetical protein